MNSTDTRAAPGSGFTVFETAIGWCGIAWGPGGIAGVQLPESDRERTLARLQRRFPSWRQAAPPPEVQQAMDGVVSLLRGEQPDLAAVSLDMAAVPAFNQRVYGVARSIPPGQTLTYGEIAARLGEPRLAREVGQALGQNPFAILVPCHRVVAAGGKTGGFSARGGVATKLRMLALEGAATPQLLPLFD
ncbi:MAG: methylated-DNA--[protein]-cysteine S-methyltransferase [Chloroflexi bacterium]|nr:methylated-DNA--[protein]-cysteine S-methyltransferase [Chloroflexota bacterium]